MWAKIPAALFAFIGAIAGVVVIVLLIDGSRSLETPLGSFRFKKEEFGNEVQYIYFSDSLATQHEWVADAIFNKNFKRVCERAGGILEEVLESSGHFHAGLGNGYFYPGWYYAGERFCPQDRHVYLRDGHSIDDPYNVWQYSGECGCCVDTHTISASHNTVPGSNIWTFKASALLKCRF